MRPAPKRSPAAEPRRLLFLDPRGADEKPVFDALSERVCAAMVHGARLPAAKVRLRCSCGVIETKGAVRTTGGVVLHPLAYHFMVFHRSAVAAADLEAVRSWAPVKSRRGR